MCTCTGGGGTGGSGQSTGTCSGGMNSGGNCLFSSHCPPCPASSPAGGGCGDCYDDGSGGGGGRGGGGGFCFQEGTKIHTPNGLKTIENIQVGDEVKSYDIKNKEIIKSKVTETFVHDDSPAGILLNGIILLLQV